MSTDLKQIFENSVLDEENQKVIQEAFDAAVASKEQELKEQYDAKLEEQRAEDKKELNSTIEEAISEEMSEIAEELEHARNLEVTYSQKLQEFKESYAEQKDEETRVQIQEAVSEELEELKEDIETAKKYEFVMNVFESFKTTYEKMFGSSDIDVYDRLKEAEQELDSYKREQKLNELLENFTGSKKEVVRTILESVDTDKMETKFESIKPILLEQSKESDDENLEENNKENNKEEEIDESRIKIEESEEEGTGDETDNKEQRLTPEQKRLAKSVRFARGSR